jgi:hypothetical protein
MPQPQGWEKHFLEMPRSERMDNAERAWMWKLCLSFLAMGGLLSILFGFLAHNWWIALGSGVITIILTFIIPVVVDVKDEVLTETEKRLKKAIEVRNKLNAMSVQSEQSGQALKLAEETVQTLAQLATLSRTDEIALEQRAVLQTLQQDALPEAKAQLEVRGISPS